MQQAHAGHDPEPRTHAIAADRSDDTDGRQPELQRTDACRPAASDCGPSARPCFGERMA
jgi:hypothetical protein